MRHTTVHDLRQTCVTDARRAGMGYCHIMAMTEHETMAVFKRCDTVDETDWRDVMHLLESRTAIKIASDAFNRRGSGPISLYKHTPGRRSSAGRATDS